MRQDFDYRELQHTSVDFSESAATNSLDDLVPLLQDFLTLSKHI
jgi:hypothetical protein